MRFIWNPKIFLKGLYEFKRVDFKLILLLTESEAVKGNIVKTFGISWHYREDYL